MTVLIIKSWSFLCLLPLFVVDTSTTAMHATDEAADSTLKELFDDLFYSSFQPLRTAVALIGKGIIEEDLRDKCRRSDLSDNEKSRAIIDAVRSNGENGVFQTFVTVLEWDPGNVTIVHKVKGWLLIV